MWYGYGGCTTRWEERRGSIEDELEEKYYGEDGLNFYKKYICLQIVKVLLLINSRSILYLGQTPSMSIWPDQIKHISYGKLLCLLTPYTISFP
jgi:hypothetical protein